MPDEYHDNRRHHFTIVDNEVLSMGLNPYELRVYIELCHRANGDRECWPSLTTLAKDCKMSRPKLIKSIASLEQEGLITVDRGKAKNGNNSVNRYTVNPVLKIPLPSKPDLLPSKPDLLGVVNDVDHNNTHIEQEITVDKSTVRPAIDYVVAHPDPKSVLKAVKDSPPDGEVQSSIHSLMFGAICTAFNMDIAKLTRNERSNIGKAAKQLCEAGRSPEDVRRIYEYCKRHYENFNVMALTTNASKALAPPSKAKQEPTAIKDVKIDISNTVDLSVKGSSENAN